MTEAQAFDPIAFKRKTRQEWNDAAAGWRKWHHVVEGNDDPPVEQPEELLRTLGADDVKWINQCIADNKGGASDAVIRKYCFCMNGSWRCPP